jgi:hypothetical protein
VRLDTSGSTSGGTPCGHGAEAAWLAFISMVERDDQRRRGVVFVVGICRVVKAYSSHGVFAVLVEPLRRPEQ